MGQGTIRHIGPADWPLTLVAKAPGETRRLGEILGEVLLPGDVVALTGELGAGKTCLTQGIARGLGVAAGYEITSPTFTLINEYPGRINLYHADLYRFAGLKDFADTGFEEYFRGRGVVVVEWAEKALNILPTEYLLIEIGYISDTGRSLRLKPRGKRYQEIVAQLKRFSFES